MHLLHIHFFRMPHASKLMQNKVIIIQIMLEFKIFLNIYEKKIKMETKLFYSKWIKCKLKAILGPYLK